MAKSDNSLNPTANHVPQVTRHGAETPRPLRTYLGGVVHNAIMTAPAVPAGCIIAGRATSAVFVVVPPPGVTSYQLTWGRWSRDVIGQKELDNSDPVTVGVDQWTDEGDSWFTGVATVPFPSYLDPVGIYVSDLQGVVTSGGFRFFWRNA